MRRVEYIQIIPRHANISRGFEWKITIFMSVLYFKREKAHFHLQKADEKVFKKKCHSNAKPQLPQLLFLLSATRTIARSHRGSKIQSETVRALAASYENRSTSRPENGSCFKRWSRAPRITFLSIWGYNSGIGPARALCIISRRRGRCAAGPSVKVNTRAYRRRVNERAPADVPCYIKTARPRQLHRVKSRCSGACAEIGVRLRRRSHPWTSRASRASRGRPRRALRTPLATHTTTAAWVQPSMRRADPRGKLELPPPRASSGKIAAASIFPRSLSARLLRALLCRTLCRLQRFTGLFQLMGPIWNWYWKCKDLFNLQLDSASIVFTIHNYDDWRLLRSLENHPTYIW